MNISAALTILTESGVLTEAERVFLSRGLATRGRTKGRIRSSLPNGKSNTDIDKGVWRSLMANCAPNRSGVWALMVAGEAERDAFNTTEALLRRICGSMYNAQVLLAVTDPLRFSTLSYSYKTDNAAVAEMCAEMAMMHKRRLERLERSVELRVEDDVVRVFLGGNLKAEKNFDGNYLRMEKAIKAALESYKRDGYVNVTTVRY